MRFYMVTNDRQEFCELDGCQIIAISDILIPQLSDEDIKEGIKEGFFTVVHEFGPVWDY